MNIILYVDRLVFIPSTIDNRMTKQNVEYETIRFRRKRAEIRLRLHLICYTTYPNITSDTAPTNNDTIFFPFFVRFLRLRFGNVTFRTVAFSPEVLRIRIRDG
jgi:hypothetical protein